jgi:hypothetical protein
LVINVLEGIFIQKECVLKNSKAVVLLCMAIIKIFNEIDVSIRGIKIKLFDNIKVDYE